MLLTYSEKFPVMKGMKRKIFFVSGLPLLAYQKKRHLVNKKGKVKFCCTVG